MPEKKPLGMSFLCGINPRAGTSGEVLNHVFKVFGENANITLLEETADIYVLCEGKNDVLDKLRKLQANPDVLDTQIEVLRTREFVEKEVRVDNVYLVLVDVGAGDVDGFINALKAEVDRVAAGDIEILYIGEIFSPRADVVAMVTTNLQSTWTIGQRVRVLPGVVDTQVFTLRRTGNESRVIDSKEVNYEVS